MPKVPRSFVGIYRDELRLSEEGELIMRKSLFTPLFYLPLSYLVLALVAASPAVAEPPVPSWQRGSEGTTFQEWTFADGNSMPSPVKSTFYNPNAGQMNPVLLNVDTVHRWFNEVGQMQGVWALSGEIDIVIPNYPQQNPYKQIQLYLVWKPEKETDLPIERSPFLPDSPLVAVTPFNEMLMSINDVIEDSWHYSTYDITIWPNPEKEWFTIKGNILVDHVAIDTICVPEPATIIIVAFGMLGATRRRKK
jgi:hypothetical protein